jgi:hypothetical protein
VSWLILLELIYILSNLYILGTAGGNADVCEVKSASSQQMKFPSERSDYDVGSFNLEENKELSGDKAQIEDNQELYAATPSDPNVHLMVDAGIRMFMKFTDSL